MRRILSVSVALVLVALAALGLRSYWPRELDPIQRLTVVSSASGRDIEPRLTGGFRWAPLRKAKRGGDELEGDGLMLAAVAGETIQKVPQDRHAVGIAQLMIGKPRVAAATLETVTGNSAETWSDLAAARYTLAIRDDDPSQLPRALAAADAALRLNPNLPEARFNRALVIERLGLRDQAREQWDAYLAIDGGSEWAVEAREHVRKLQPLPVFKEELERSYDRLARDPEAAHAFARQYRQESRLWGETEILGRWASAERDGKSELALKHLRLARELGAELARDRGDQMLQALVAAIERADPQQRRALVTAHLAFREGQKTYKNDQPAKAEPILVSAAESFDHGGSPGALLARYFAANIAFDQGRIDEARTKLERLLATSPPPFIAHRAQVLWQMGLVSISQGRWGDSIEELSDSVEIFERLDEQFYAASVREILAEAYDRIGNPSAAWPHRMIALREIGKRVHFRLLVGIASMSRAAALTKDWASAVSLLSLEVEIARRLDERALQVEALLLRARAHHHMEGRDAAIADLSDARKVLSTVSDPGYRAHLDANTLAVEGFLASTPSSTAELLTKAIAFHRSNGRTMYVPELLLARGRAFLSMKEHDRASADFEEGVLELESDRVSLQAGENRWGVFDNVEELFEEATSLALSRNDPATAFRYVERERARSLLDALGATSPSVSAADVPRDAVVVEYSVHARELVIFLLDGRGVQAIRSPVERSTLDSEVHDFVEAAKTSNVRQLRRAGQSLYRRLIGPIENQLAENETLVLVPDSSLTGVPFAALTDGAGRFLIETRALTIAPSVAVFARLKLVRRTDARRTALIVSGAEDLGALSAADREANGVAAEYSRVTRLKSDMATREAFMREARNAAVIHFVGHSVASTHGAGDGYLLLTQGRLGAREIAATRLPYTSLVVLAACGTAAGQRRSAEGTISVARAFVAAGVPGVVATLWPIVDEDAAAFFPEFHRNIARGMSAAEALRSAQLGAIRADSPSALWSAVQLIGH